MTNTPEPPSLNDYSKTPDYLPPEKLWEVRSTTTVVLKTYVKARFREEAKHKALQPEAKWKPVSDPCKLAANTAWYGELE